MPAGAETRRHRLRYVIRGFAYLVIALIVSLLTGCGLSPDWGRRPQPTATPAPLALATPTAFILSSEALYADARRHIGTTSHSFASLPAGAVLPPAPAGGSERGVTVLLDARTTLQGELHQPGGQSRPAILILAAELAAWGALPQKLSGAGFVVLALQTAPSTPARLVDLMLQSLIAIPGVDAGRLGMAGETRSADLAMLGCAVNSLCDALALLSPTSSDTLLNLRLAFGERALWLATSRSDSASRAAALSLSQALPGRAQVHEAASGQGAGILSAEAGLADSMVAFFTLHLKDG